MKYSQRRVSPHTRALYSFTLRVTLQQKCKDLCDVDCTIGIH